ncbi:hypothetical protein EE612_029244, partial [Oryza sativa]
EYDVTSAATTGLRGVTPTSCSAPPHRSMPPPSPSPTSSTSPPPP